MLRFHRFFAMALSSLVFSGCSVIDSNRAGTVFLGANGQPAATQFIGTYSLPRRLMSFEVLGTSTRMHQSTAFSVKRDPASDLLVPDASSAFRYTINYKPSRFSKDKVDVKIDNQILQSITTSTEDQSGRALIDLAEAFGRISRLGSGLGLDTPGAGAGDETKIDKTVGIVRLDPTDPASLARAQNLLRGHLEIQVTPSPRPVVTLPACNHSVCFRPLTSVVVTFRDRKSGNVIEFAASVPDPHQIEGLDIERSPFIKRDTILTFADGSPKSIDVTKPSEVAAAALLPLAVVEAVFKGVNDAVQSLLGLKKNDLAAQADLLNAQASMLKALAAYRKTYSETFPNGVDSGGGNSPSLDTVGSEINAEDDDSDSPGLEG
ncbi:hypothetical protein [uncultured Roseobacter sp.]|uniref:hypothetical protein n=1 Tax=uncultured Roseobacter sp. TaxID=114847 RepID=UPI002637E699|nr:hypothetical protein [uncultured Roseobacter sp.]